MPISVIAENIAIKQETNENTSEESLAPDEDVFIVQEDTTKRGEFEKHYICSDGTYVVASYAEAIHYKDDNGNWIDVDNRPMQTTEGAYATRNGDFGISVPSSTSDGHLMRMDKGEHSLSWTLSANKKAGTIKMDSSVSTMAQKPVQSQKMQVGTAKHPEIIVSNTEQPRENHKVLRDEATFDLPNVSGKVRYDDLFGAGEGVSVVYTTYRNKIEEDIYIEKPTGITSFSMEVAAPDLTPRLNADKSVDFLDNDGKICYHVGIPYMMDADFAVLNDIETTVIRSGDIWVITYTPDAEWFTSEDRVYPILLDPSITTNEYRTNIQDTYVEEGDSTVHSSEQLLYINGGTGRRKAVIRFLTLPAVDDTMPLISAKLDFSSQYAPFSDVGLTLSYVPGNRSIGIGAYTYEKATIAADFSFSSFLSIGQTRISFDVTNNIYDILEGTGDFVLGYSADGDTTFCYPFHSANSSTGMGPVLTITYGYSLPDGVADGAILALQNYGSTLFASVSGTDPAEYANVYQVERDDWIPTTNELFRLQYNAETGAYRLYSMASSSGTNRMLTVYTSTNGLIYGSKNVRLEDLDDNPEISQDWMIVSHDGTTFRLLPRSNMSVCLTANGDTEGTSSGTGTGSAGNICVKTVDTNSDYQLWWLVNNEVDDNGNPLIYTSEYAPATLENGLYYFINRYSGRYLYQNGSTAMSTRGFITDTRTNNNVSNTSASLYQVYREFISWRITNLGDGYCTIQNPISMSYLYAQTDTAGKLHANRYVKIGRMDDSIPDNFKWRIYIAPGGGMLFKSKLGDYYLSLNETSLQTRNANIRMYGQYSSSSTYFGQQVWRVFQQEEYEEPTGHYTLNIYNLDIGETKAPSVASSIDTSLDKATDFFYEDTSNYVSVDQIKGTITGLNPGTINLVATHKTTGFSYILNIEIACISVAIPCVYGQSLRDGTIKNFPTAIEPYLSEYSSLLTNLTWTAYENNVIIFDKENMTVSGIGTGFAWLEATNNNQVICRCYIYVDDILRGYHPDIQDYLMSDGDFLATLSVRMWENGGNIDPLILRTEWFLYTIKLHNEGKTDSEIRTLLHEKFGLYTDDEFTYRAFLSLVLMGANGSLSREKTKLSFDGLRDFFNFFWFQYAAYSITTIDTVNIYTPATEQDVIAEQKAAQKMCKEARTVVQQAQQSQTTGGYKADQFQATLLKKGDIVYGLRDGQSNWYFPQKYVDLSQKDQVTLNQGLQIPPHKTMGYRKKIGTYVVKNDIYVASGYANNNVYYNTGNQNIYLGEGGYYQYYIHDYLDNLELIEETYLNNLIN